MAGLCIQAGSASDSVVVFARDAASGHLVFAQVEFDGGGGVDGLDSPAGVAVAPNGRHVLTAGRGTDDALALFAPEPGAAVALQGAVVALGWLAWRRRPIASFNSALFASTTEGETLHGTFTLDPDTTLVVGLRKRSRRT
jgi:hypothetical protein